MSQAILQSHPPCTSRPRYQTHLGPRCPVKWLSRSLPETCAIFFILKRVTLRGKDRKKKPFCPVSLSADSVTFPVALPARLVHLLTLGLSPYRVCDYLPLFTSFCSSCPVCQPSRWALGQVMLHSSFIAAVKIRVCPYSLHLNLSASFSCLRPLLLHLGVHDGTIYEWYIHQMPCVEPSTPRGLYSLSRPSREQLSTAI